MELARTFQIEEKVLGMLHDNASNFTLCARMLKDKLGWDYQPCMGHSCSLQLASN